MKEILPVAPTLKIKWKGIFNLDELYKNMKYWLEFNGYGNHESNFQEKKYVERIKGDTKQIEIKWFAQRNIGNYFAWVINVSFFILGLKDIEIEENGRKMKSQQGEIEIRINSEIVKDRGDRWKSKLMQSIYEKFIVKERIESHKTALYVITYNFHDEIKAYFSMHN